MDINTVAGVHARWIEARSRLTAENIANTDTPGYERAAGSAFKDLLTGTASPFVMKAPHASHISPEPHAPGFETRREGAVSLQREMVDLAANRRAHDLNVGIAAAFHRFHMSVAR